MDYYFSGCWVFIFGIIHFLKLATIHEILKSICEDESLYVGVSKELDCHPKELPHFQFLKLELGKAIDSPLSDLAAVNFALNFYDFDVFGSNLLKKDRLIDIFNDLPANQIIEIANWYTGLFKKGFDITDNDVVVSKTEKISLHTIELLISTCIALDYEVEYQKILNKLTLVPRKRWYYLYEIDSSNQDQVEQLEHDLGKLIPLG